MKYMIQIKDYEFKDNIDVERNKTAINWPVVYLIENDKQIYIGETNNFKRRMKQHYMNPQKRILKRVHLISDNDFNKSAIRDIESALIGYFDADKKYKLLNSNNGVINQDYFNRLTYKNKIPIIWEKLQNRGLAEKEIFQLENSDLFKYSPYKSLSDDQFEIAHLILRDSFKEKKWTSFIEGNPGTGKTILAMYLLKILAVSKAKENKKVALVVPMTSLRKTLKKVAKSINGLYAYHIIGPSDVIKKNYDTLIIDEAHRLKRRVSITNYKSFDDTNKYLGLGIYDGDQLDWILLSANHHIFFYDEGQSIKPTDIKKEKFNELKLSKSKIQTIYSLTTQHRVLGGREYINYANDILNNNNPKRQSFKDYDIKLFNDFSVMNNKIKKLEKQYKLVRIVSGYSFKWISDNDKTKYDIILDGVYKQWNTTSQDWVNSPNAKNEIGCIHTVQGYDLNYIGLIFGYEIDYDFDKKTIIINKDKYYDIKGKSSINNESDLKDYIINIYITLMTRGIKGIYMYACNKNFRMYLEQFFEKDD